MFAPGADGYRVADLREAASLGAAAAGTGKLNHICPRMQGI